MPLSSITIRTMFSKDELFTEKLNEEKGLESVSNSHLLKLHKVGSQVKDKFGSRDKLIQAIQDTEKRTKDEGFRNRLEEYSLPRLWDYYEAALKRAARSKPKTRRKKKSRKKSRS